MASETAIPMTGKGDEVMSFFRPPIVRSAGATLNRALFAKTVDIAAARVNDPKHIAKYRKQLEKEKDILLADRLSAVVNDPDETLAAQGRKCLLLRPGIKLDGWSMFCGEKEYSLLITSYSVR
jgi:tRNA (guanine37-N1)-methyltransferase